MATAPTPKNDAPQSVSLYNRALPAWAAGVVATAVTVAISLPLRSPDDLVGNTASIGIISVSAAVVLGIIWARLYEFALLSRFWRFAAISLALLFATVVVALIIEPVADISNAATFVAPLAAAMLTLTTLGTPLIQTHASISALRFAVPVLAILTVAAGVVLTLNEVGFNQPPSLSLPPPP